MTDFDWKIIHRFADGHKYFSDLVSGRDAIADASGSRPHLTDDGVLWLDLDRNPCLHDYRGRIGIWVPLESEDGSYTITPCSVEEGVWFARRYGKLVEFEHGKKKYVLDPSIISDSERLVNKIKSEYGGNGPDTLHLSVLSEPWTNLNIMEESLAENRSRTRT